MSLEPGRARVEVLVINDAFPDPESTDADLHLLQILQALRGAGHEVTLVCRDGRNHAQSEATLQPLGVEVYAGDAERMFSLGVEIDPAKWSLQELLTTHEFAVAILAHNFRCGITIPEHYLDAIRKHSPQTKIAILSTELNAVSAAGRAEVSQQLEHHEVAQDWFGRELEALRRADLAIVSHELDAKRLLRCEPGLTVSVVPMTCEVRPRAMGWKARQGVLFAVDFKRGADVDGFVWFLQRVWTLITRESRDIELLIVGGEEVPLESRKKLSQVKWISAKDLGKTMACARIFISPQRFAVAKSSMLHMAASGLPGVGTTYAAEASGLAGLAADTPEDFTRHVLRLYQDRELWEKQSGKTQESVANSFSEEALKSRVANFLTQAEKLECKPGANSPVSITLVDSLGSEILRKASPKQRSATRLDGHVQIAQQMLREGNPPGAIQQLRHVFSWLGESIKPTPPLARLLAVLAQCYRELGEPAMVARCAKEARRCFSVQIAPTAPRVVTSLRKSKNAPLISLIVPTFNRLPILKKCLAALEAQTISRESFEVIVIDDGSSDGTEETMRHYQPPFRFQYLRQNNSGTGTARRNGVEHASGEYLLLMNDDTICNPDVIEQHLRMQKSIGTERWAVLGNFEYPDEARRRALTHFLRVGAFMFPQVEMEDGFPYPYSHFITCNLSIRREAVVQAGSFDSTYKLSEDTELGIRLFEMGFGVLYHRAAHAWHDHVQYAVSNLIRRARVYGADYFYMFGRHPRVIQEWAMPLNLAGLNGETALRIRAYLKENRRDVEAAVAALASWDTVEFEPVLGNPQQTAHVLALFEKAVPAIHWFYLFESMLETITRELHLPANEELSLQATSAG